MAGTDSKRCPRCKQTLPTSEFVRCSGRADGLYTYCKRCKYERFHSNPKEVEKERLRQKSYKRPNPARDCENARAWQAANREKWLMIVRSASARRRSIQRLGLGGAELNRWASRQKKVCYWCGIGCAKAYHIDHYVPLSKGGSHTKDNLVIACPACNRRKGARDPFEFAQERGRLL